MTSPIAKKASHYLHTNHHELQCLLQKVNEINALNSQLSLYLDSHLNTSCHVANTSNHQLVILTANASVATELRFQSHDLLNKFKQDPLLKKIHGIHCKVSPAFGQPFTAALKPTRKMSLLSKETAEIIQKMAASLSDDKLRKTMESIASMVKPQPK